MFTVEDLCQRYTVTEHTILRWIADGELRALNVARKSGARKPRWRITQAALDAFEASRSTTEPPTTPSRRRRRQAVGADAVDFFPNA